MISSANYIHVGSRVRKEYTSWQAKIYVAKKNFNHKNLFFLFLSRGMNKRVKNSSRENWLGSMCDYQFNDSLFLSLVLSYINSRHREHSTQMSPSLLISLPTFRLTDFLIYRLLDLPTFRSPSRGCPVLPSHGRLAIFIWPARSFRKSRIPHFGRSLNHFFTCDTYDCRFVALNGRYSLTNRL